jgi:uncharacterized protein YlxW (UPF0749 family)
MLTRLFVAIGLRGWIIVALVIACSALVLANSWALSRAERAELDAATWKAAHTAIVANVKAAQEAADTKLKEREDAMQARLAEAVRKERAAAAQNEARLRAAVAAERADAVSLRDQLAERLSCAAAPAGDSAAAGGDSAAAIGDVLAEALRLQAELSEAAERHSSDVRKLLDGWPGP